MADLWPAELLAALTAADAARDVELVPSSCDQLAEHMFNQALMFPPGQERTELQRRNEEILQAVPPKIHSILLDRQRTDLLRCMRGLPASSHQHVITYNFLSSPHRSRGQLIFAQLEREEVHRPSRWSPADKADLITAVAGTEEEPFTDVTFDEWWFEPAEASVHASVTMLLNSRALSQVTRLVLPPAAPEIVASFASAVPTYSHLQKLFLNSGRHLAPVMEAGRRLTSLQVLGVAKGGSCNETTGFIRTLDEYTMLSALTLQSCLFGDGTQSASFARCLQTLTRLRELKLHSCFSDDDPSPVFTALKNHRRLIELVLDGNMLDTSSFDEFVPMLGHLSDQLRKLHLIDFALPSAEELRPMRLSGLGGIPPELRVYARMCECLGRMSQLTSLCLSGWDCLPAFWMFFSMNCTALTALQSLKCQVASIDVDAGQGLASTLECMQSLKYLDLGRNPLEAAAADIARSVASLSALTRLCLHGCEIKQPAALMVLSELPQMTALKSLDLAGSELGMEGAQALVTALDTLPGLQCVNLLTSDVGSQGKELLDSAVRSRPAALPQCMLPPWCSTEHVDAQHISWAQGIWEVLDD